MTSAIPAPRTTSDPEKTYGESSPPGRAPLTGIEIDLDDLAHGHRLAGQQRFVDLQVLAFDERSIRGNTIAFGKNDDVAARHFAAWNSFALAVANDQRARTRQVPKRFQNALGARFLNDGDYDGEVGEDEKDQSFPPVAQRQVDDAAGDQQGEHRLAQNLEHNSQRRAAVRPRKFVVAFGLQPCLSFGFAEADLPVLRRRDFHHDRPSPRSRGLRQRSPEVGQRRQTRAFQF